MLTPRMRRESLADPVMPPATMRLARDAALVFMGAVAAFGALAALVDALWPSAQRPGWATPTQVAHSLGVALLSVIATVAYVSWRRTPFLRSVLGRQEEQGALPALLDRAATLAGWLVGLRWVALVITAAVLLVATVGRPRVLPESVLPLWLGLTALLVLNLLWSFMRARWLSGSRGLVVQVLADNTIFLWLVHHAGGLANPFSAFVVFPLVIAAMAIPTRHARQLAGAAAAQVLMLTGLEAWGVLPAACVVGADGVCRVPDTLHIWMGGATVATVFVGCILFVGALVGALDDERHGVDRARAALQVEQEKLQSIIDCMADVVIFADRHGRVLLRNRASSQLWPHGVPAEHNLTVCHNPQTWDRMLAKLGNAGPRELHPVLVVDGRSFEATYARVCDPHGGLRGVVMVARDITERLQTQSWRMQEERMAVVGKLAAGLAHELNNPLGSIALFTQHALKRVPANDPLKDHLGTVLRNANQCKKIVRDLLDYARQRPPEKRPTDVAELLHDVSRTLDVQASRAGVALKVITVDPSTPVTLDPDQLRQVLVNLGLNAIEAMASGGTLTLRGERLPDGLRIRVEDTGPGIPVEQQERVFTAFFTTKETGTGLGLAVAQDLVRAHGGSLCLESSPGHGCTFTVSLPDHTPHPHRSSDEAAYPRRG